MYVCMYAYVYIYISPSSGALHPLPLLAHMYIHTIAAICAAFRPPPDSVRPKAAPPFAIGETIGEESAAEDFAIGEAIGEAQAIGIHEYI